MLVAVPRIIGEDSTPGPDLLIGKSFYIECRFTGIPEPRVVWRKDQDVINATNGHYEVTTIPASFQSRLETLSTLKPTSEFNGLYECIVTNDAGSDNRSFNIELKGK